MKISVSVFMLSWSLLGGMVAFTSDAQAQSPQAGYRYTTTYYAFDSGFTSYCGYNEPVRCQRTYRGGWVSQTCYDMEPNTTVYVEEKIMDNGYSRVRVYRTSTYNDPYAEYYVYNRTVEYRSYYSSYPTYYSRTYYGPTYYSSSRVWVSLDWNNGWDKVAIGTYWAVVGTSIALDAASMNSSAGVALGLGSALSGSISASAGSNQIEEESRLQKHIANQRKKNNVYDFED